MTRPNSSSYPSFYARYIDAVQDDDILNSLQVGKTTSCEFLKSIPMNKWTFRYEEGKWSIKELVLHIIDTERIMSYRALRIARGDKTPIPGFEENDYVVNSNADARSVQSILDEYKAVREATLSLFYNFTDEMWNRTGMASGHEFSALAIAFILTGHELHHYKILRERYLVE